MKRARVHVAAAIAIGVVAASSAGSVAARSDGVETEPPVEFTAQTTYAWQPAEGVEDNRPDGSATLTGRAYQWRFVETSDPRIDGTMTLTLTGQTYLGEEIDIHAETYRIENERGAWQELPCYHFSVPWHGDDDGGVSQHIFVGEDGYDGYFVLADSTWIEDGPALQGYIVEGEPPVAPPPWSAE